MDAGSSPLARGLHEGGVRPRRRHRIIPARAGFTSGGGPRRQPPPDHPRSRGVYSTILFRLLRGLGSSPLARGLLSGPEKVDSAAGIIPARAGFTPTGGVRGRGRRDHPRSRGVYAYIPMRMTVWAGSSPLARGLPTLVDCLDGPERIIPARAGFTGRRGRGRVPTLDHPRSRGVYLQVIPQQAMTPGSSPLARGLPPRGGEGRARRGIIPARAGFTSLFAEYQANGGDHPRSRGVYSSQRRTLFPWVGSSPLARGLPSAIGNLMGGNRIIPARAGFTVNSVGLLYIFRDHPRSRGVYSVVTSAS